MHYYTRVRDLEEDMHGKALVSRLMSQLGVLRRDGYLQSVSRRSSAASPSSRISVSKASNYPVSFMEKAKFFLFVKASRLMLATMNQIVSDRLTYQRGA